MAFSVISHLVLSGASLALSAVLCLLIFCERANTGLLKIAMIMVPICSGAYVLLLGKEIFLWDSDARLVLRVLAVSGVYFLWLAVRLLFDDLFVPGYWQALTLVAVTCLAWLPSTHWMNSGGLGVAGNYAIVVVAFILSAHMLWILVAGENEDLDESRRRMRPIMAGIGAFYVLLMTCGRVVSASIISSSYFDLIGLAVLVAIKLTVVVKTRGRPNTIGLILNSRASAGALSKFEQASGNTQHVSPSLSIKAHENSESEQRKALELSGRIRSERLYADCTLTLAGLAVLAALPEYRIRQLINRVLGFRNFSVFLNNFRLDEAIQRLDDPGQAKVPILSIALDTGFGSIGPFNRSFRKRFGLTPGEFRQLAASERKAIMSLEHDNVQVL